MLRIIETHGKTRDGWNATYRISAERDGKEVLGFRVWPLHECPEDASLERDLSFAYDAIEFFKLGLEAAKAGEEVVFEEVEDEE